MHLRPLFLFALLLLSPVDKGWAQNLAAGEASFRKCLPCHAVGPDARNKVGPLLNGLDGRKAGTIEGYKYSEANRTSGIVWAEETFRNYIRNPKAAIPGTTMAFAGIADEQEAAALWAYLRQFNATPGKSR